MENDNFNFVLFKFIIIKDGSVILRINVVMIWLFVVFIKLMCFKK